ncbi:MAG TPA: hypothetical protein VIY53_01210 [Acidobacteriaceae bacterium]
MRASCLSLAQRALAASTLLVSASLTAQTMVPWRTRAADNSRSGWNTHETLLNQQNLTAKGIVRATIIPLVGDARGMEAQPLILPHVQTARGMRDVMVLPSMADVVRGVDAHDGSGIWQTALGTPLTSSAALDMWGINQHWGCISTGVIDPGLGRLYQVCMVLPNAQETPLPAAAPSTDPTKARYFMFVLSVADGTLVTPPVLIEGTSGGQNFNQFPRKQRSSLVETSVNGVKTVFGCSGTFAETAQGAAGWCFAFDVATNKLAAMLATTAGEGAGIWMAGQGPAADADGNLYLVTSNGDFDGVSQWGESLLKISYTPAAGGAAAKLAVVDHWTPWTDDARTGGAKLPADKLAGVSAPSDALRRPVGGAMKMSLANSSVKGEVDAQGNITVRVYPAMAQGAWADEDWGSAGPACIFEIGVCVASGKDGIGYPVSTANLGGTTVADLSNPATNCGKLAGPPVWLTMDPGPVDPCPADPATLNFFPWGDTAHMHMTPPHYYDPVAKTWTIFAWGENNQLHKWSVTPPGKLSYVAQSNEYASADVRRTRQHGGMPGGFCSGSSNGADPNSALLVCTIPYGDANEQVTNGRLLVYDPVHLAADGNLKVLWDSQAEGISFLFNKFNPPVIDGGQIYVPNYNGGVDVYRLTN